MTAITGVTAVDDDMLRAMAAHRGFKLLKSRRRKPGTGDFGKFGLVDAAGKALLGVGDDGLTASAAAIEAYLRQAATNDWQVSAATTPARPAAVEKAVVVEDNTPVRRRAKAPRSRTVSSRAVSDEPVPKPKPEPEPEPVLEIRAAKTGDEGAVAALLGLLAGVDIDAAEVLRNIAAVRKAGGGMVVADLAGMVGCCGWAVVQTVQHGPIGRLTVMVVREGHRRRGIATAMLAAATAALRQAGCGRVEVLSDIEVRNSHGFFRSLKFDQTSYRFVRTIAG